MGGQVPGPIGTESNHPWIDAGTLARVATPRPGFVDTSNAATGAGSNAGLASRLNQSLRWIDLEPLAVQLLGRQSFSLGVLHGMGAQVLDDIAGLAGLVKTLILADLHDQARRQDPGTAPLSFAMTALSGPVGLARTLGAGAAALFFEKELSEAAKERDELIAALRYVFTHPQETVENIAQEYVQKWRDFEQLSRQPSLSSQFQAGTIFGQLLLEVLLLFASGAGLVKLAAKVPHLSRVATRLSRLTKALPRDAAGRPMLRQSRPGAVKAPQSAEAPTPSQLVAERPGASSAASPAPEPAPGLHNQQWDQVTAKDFRTRRKVDLRNLSDKEQMAADTLLNQGRTNKDVEQLLSSGDNFRPKTLQPGDKLYGFDSKSNPYGMKNQSSMYWLDEAGYNDVKGRYFKQGQWDREGVKNYLALPCYNRADVIDTATVTRQQTAIESTIGKATEQLGYTKADATTGMLSKMMSGGGAQITPDSSALSTVSRLTGTP